MARTMPRTARNTPRVTLYRAKEDYQLRALENPKKWTEKELRQEYSRLRSVANKRIDRLLKSEFSDSEAAQQNDGKFVTLSEIKDLHELAAKVNEVVRFLNAKSSTVTGQKEIRRQTIKSLSEAGIDIPEKDYAEFGRYMEWARRTFSPDFDSEQAADIYTSAKFRGVSINVVMSNYKTFKENYDLFTDPTFSPPPKPGRRTSAREIFEALGVDEAPRGAKNLNSWYAKNTRNGNWAKKR